MIYKQYFFIELKWVSVLRFYANLGVLLKLNLGVLLKLLNLGVLLKLLKNFLLKDNLGVLLKKIPIKMSVFLKLFAL